MRSGDRLATRFTGRHVTWGHGPPAMPSETQAVNNDAKSSAVATGWRHMESLEPTFDTLFPESLAGQGVEPTFRTCHLGNNKG
jgi:hypothetical protein